MTYNEDCMFWVVTKQWDTTNNKLKEVKERYCSMVNTKKDGGRKMKTYRLNGEIILTEEQIQEIVEAYNESKCEYPIFKRSLLYGHIVKFDSLISGTVVWKGDGMDEIGYHSENWIEHTEDIIWEDVPYDKERKLWHKQPIYCWDNSYKAVRYATFYDAISKCAFTYNNYLCGYNFDNYEPIPLDRCDDWTIKAYNNLKGK